MANTANIGKSATAGRGQRGERRFGGRFYRAIGLAAIALVVLGLGAGAIISGTRTATVPAAAPNTASNPYWEYVEDVPIDAPQSVLSNPFAYDPHVYTEWDFKEDRRTPAAMLSVEEQRFLEQNTQLPTGILPFTGDPTTHRPADASTSVEFLWDFGASYAQVGPVPAFDWEQQERTQVAPGTIPAASTPIPGSGPCRPGSTDCLLDEAFVVGVKPATPTVYAGTCRAGSSDCLPEEYITPGGAGYSAGNSGSTHSRDY